MKKTFLLLLFTFLLTACSDDDKTVITGKFDKTEASILVGEETTITIDIAGASIGDIDYKWSIDDPSVLKLNDTPSNSATVTGLQAGNTIVRFTSTDGLISLSCKVSVETGNIKFESENILITDNEPFILPITYSNDFLKTKKYTVSTSNPSIADIILNEDGNIAITKKRIGQTTVSIKSEDNTLEATCTVDIKIGSVKKWVAFGNSITKHAITSFWWGEWGMAATVKEKDYVHVFNKLLEDKYGNKMIFDAVNIAAWERDFKAFDKNSIDKYLTGDEDIIVIRLGENVPSKETVYTNYKEELDALVLYMKKKSPKANFIITGNFWTEKRKDAIQKEIAEKHNCIWVSLDHLDTPENKSTLDTKVFGDDGKWHLISEGGGTASGVAAHPGDKGMANIADAIFKSIQ